MGHCIDNDTCHFVTGQCERGCKAGWTGELCDKGKLESNTKVQKIWLLCKKSVFKWPTRTIQNINEDLYKLHVLLLFI